MIQTSLTDMKTSIDHLAMETITSLSKEGGIVSRHTGSLLQFKLREFALKLHGDCYAKHFLYINLYEVARFLSKSLKNNNLKLVAVRRMAIRLASFLRQE